MSSDEELKNVDRILREATTHVMADGWPSRDVDDHIADRLYERWLKDTDTLWRTSGFRDRDRLWEALEETFTQHYGEDGGRARTVIYTLLLECQSRETGQTHRATPTA